MNLMKREFFVISILVIFCSTVVFGMKNPAAVYCNALGYEYVNEETPEGSVGICKFSENLKCEGWAFLSGKCGQEQSYCKKNGYGIKTVANFKTCSDIVSEECTVCILKNGSEVEVTKLMKLNFNEGVCGNGFCEIGENYKSCPNDCPSGSRNGYCDGISEGICDPDCGVGEDPDCRNGLTTTTIGAKCGDEVCEKNENFANCPQDCQSGGNDNYCDGIKDDICDPDCKPEFDPDCKAELCGNKNCDVTEGENFATCSQDCPSGGKDNYCDKIKDRICDPDCSQTDDSDCVKADMSLYIFLLIGAVIVIAVIFFIRKRRSGY